MTLSPVPVFPLPIPPHALLTMPARAHSYFTTSPPPRHRLCTIASCYTICHTRLLCLCRTAADVASLVLRTARGCVARTRFRARHKRVCARASLPLLFQRDVATNAHPLHAFLARYRLLCQHVCGACAASTITYSLSSPSYRVAPPRHRIWHTVCFGDSTISSYRRRLYREPRRCTRAATSTLCDS